MYRAGEWKAVCDRCGFDFRNVELTLEWTGLRVCRKCLDHRHPQETLIARADRQAPEWVRPVAPETAIGGLQAETGEYLMDENGQILLVE